MSELKVCGRHSVRSSQMPASGVPATAMARRVSSRDQIEHRRRHLLAEARVEEQRRQRQHHLAEHVVLLVQRRGVADAHRLLALVAAPVR